MTSPVPRRRGVVFHCPGRWAQATAFEAGDRGPGRLQPPRRLRRGQPGGCAPAEARRRQTEGGSAARPVRDQTRGEPRYAATSIVSLRLSTITGDSSHSIFGGLPYFSVTNAVHVSV